MRTNVLRVVAVALACGVLLPAATPAQSLGELALKEAERRKSIKTPGKVYTNDTIGAPRQVPPAPGVPAAAASAPPSSAAPGEAPGQPSAPASQLDPVAPAPAAAAAKQDEAAWRKRMQSERDSMQRAQMFADALQTRINSLTADFTARDDPFQREQISADRLKALAELDRVKQEIQDHTKAIATIQEEARKAGVPPGWVR
jgi:hypothetical protein